MFMLTVVYTIKGKLQQTHTYHTDTSMYASLHCLLVNFMPLCTLINERIN